MQLGISKSISKRKKESAFIMRKQTKLVAVLSTAALLAIGASMTSFAAQGWVEEDGTWVYYNSDGERATETWKKSGSNWYWLNDDGEMSTDELIEDDDNYYYVDANGAMVTNQWVAIENEDAGEDDEPDHWWYYFQANGKAYKKSETSTTVSTKTINGKKYIFDDEGKMMYGWINESGDRETDEDTEWKEGLYYAGDEDDGALRTNEWALIAIKDDAAADAQPGDDYWDEDQERWFWFKASGKKQTSESDDADAIKVKKVNGVKYGFDEYGRMVASWYSTLGVASVESASVAQGSKTDSFLYFSDPESGARATKGWFKVVPGYYLNQSNYDDDAEKWFYADSDGSLYRSEIKKIKGKRYAFDVYGRMISGLVFLGMDNDTTINTKYADDDSVHPYDTEDGFDDFSEYYRDQIIDGSIRAYYFGGSDDGAMKTGKQNVTIDGESISFKFETGSASKGAGLNGIDDDKAYIAGKQIKADKDDKYEFLEVETVDGVEYIKDELTVAEFIAASGVDYEIINTDGDKAWYFDTDEAIAFAKNYRLLNASGTVLKNKSSAKDGDDYKVTVKSHVVTKIVLERVLTE
jgi:glucan-binding YG repeat protein